MAKVKCRYCGKELDRNDAFLVKKGKLNVYYCNEEHSKLKTDREIFFEKAYEIFGKTTNTAFIKEMNDLSTVHGFKKMYSYLLDNTEYLTSVLDNYQHKFKSEFAKIRYFSTILANSLGDYVPKKHEVVKDCFQEEDDGGDYHFKKKEQDGGLDDLLGDIL